MPAPEVFMAVVQHGDDEENDTVEMVTVTFDRSGLPTIELTNGQRIQAVERVGGQGSVAA